MLDLILSLDKWAHLAGAFTWLLVLDTMLYKFKRLAAVIIVYMGILLIECYQWLYEPMYITKLQDTGLDIIAGMIGVNIGFWIMNRREK